MANSSESNVKNYLISDDTTEQFNNIATFAKNMELKNSKYYEEGENALSRWFGDMLLKYYNYGLTIEETADLLRFVSAYNNAVSSVLTNEEAILKLLGLHKNQKYEESVVYYLVKKLQYDYNPEDNKIFTDAETIITIAVLKKLENYLKKSLKKSDTNIPEYFFDNNGVKNTAVSIIDFKDGDKIYDKDENEYTFNGSGCKFKDSAETDVGLAQPLTDDSDDSNTTKTESDSPNETIINTIRICGLYVPFTCTNTNSSYKFTFSIKESNSADLDFKFNTNFSFNFDSYVNLMKKKEEIQIHTESVTDVKTKLKASELEKSMAEQGELLNVFDFRFSDSDIVSLKGQFNTTDTQTYSVRARSNQDGAVLELITGNCIHILYKELNPRYRELLNSEIVESVLAVTTSSNSDNTVYDKLFTFKTSENTVNYPFMKYIRENDPDTNVLPTVTDIKDADGNVVKTSKLYKYQYTNAYMARYAPESDIISFFYGDYYISNGYGKYQYQQLEISEFIRLFKETREYYYKVLLNESFINEDEYSLYEKTFLIYTTIERFITNKLETLKDIDSFDKTDIKNFLTSYGFGDLAEIIDKRDFFESEELSKRLIKSYIGLVSNKGSRKVIDVLEDVFSISNGTLTIYKALLTKSNSNEYKMCKVKYNSTNIIGEISNALSTAQKLEDFVDLDSYWKMENAPTEMLNKIDFHVANTKYLIPEYNVEISKNYITLRYVLAILDFMIEKQFIDDNLKINDKPLVTVLNTIRGNYNEYIDLKRKKDDKDDNNKLQQANIAYKVDENELVILYKYFSESDVTKDNKTIKYFVVKEDEVRKNINQYFNDNKDIEMAVLALNSLIPLIILKENEDNETRLTSLANYLNISSGITNVSFPILTSIFENMFNFLTMIVSGGFFNQNLAGDTINFISELFNNVFIEQEIGDIMVRVNTNKECPDPEETPAKCVNEVTKNLFDLAEQLGIDLSIQIQDNQNSLLDFLQTCLEYFISYTSEIYNTKLEVSYDSRNENVGPDDGITFNINTILVDSFYYDEKLESLIITDITKPTQTTEKTTKENEEASNAWKWLFSKRICCNIR